MQLKTIIFTLSALTSVNVFANDKVTTDNEISYDWAEINYGTDINYNTHESTFKSIDTLKLSVSKSLNDKIYFSSNLFLLHDDSRYRNNKDEFNQVELSARIGFHTKLSKQTDFFSEIGVEHLRTANLGMQEHRDDSVFNEVFIDNVQHNLITKIGTRTQINEKFHLLMTLTYVNQQLPTEYTQTSLVDGSNDVFFRYMPDARDLNINLNLFYKIKEHSQLKLGVGSKQGETVSIGWRWNW